MTRIWTLLLAAAFAASASTSFAALTFFSNDTTFSNAISNAGTEDFENNTSVASWPTPTPAAGSDLVFFGNGITGSYSPANVVDNSGGGAGGRHNTTQPIPPSKNYLLVQDSSLTITFSSPISALGFRATDLGDYSTVPFTVTLSGPAETVSFPSVASPIPFGNDGGTGTNDGSNIFYGFVGTGAYTTVTLTNGIGDLYGLDDIIVAAADGGGGGVIPEPASASVWAAMLLTGLTFIRRKR